MYIPKITALKTATTIHAVIVITFKITQVISVDNPGALSPAIWTAIAVAIIGHSQSVSAISISNSITELNCEHTRIEIEYIMVELIAYPAKPPRNALIIYLI